MSYLKVVPSFSTINRFLDRIKAKKPHELLLNAYSTYVQYQSALLVDVHAFWDSIFGSNPQCSQVFSWVLSNATTIMHYSCTRECRAQLERVARSFLEILLSP